MLHKSQLKLLSPVFYSYKNSCVKFRCIGSVQLKDKSWISGQNVVYVDGVRTPFLVSGTDYSKLMPHDLQRQAFVHLFRKTGIKKEYIDYICVGNVVQEIKTTNVAREAALGACVPDTVPAHTVAMACISSNQALTTCMGLINANIYSLCIAGGVDFLSDIPIRLAKPLRGLLLRLGRSKKVVDRIKLLMQLRPHHIIPELPSVSEFSSNETMGHFGDRVSSAFNISRKEQDEYALRSHTLAMQAHKRGLLTDVISFRVPGTEKVVSFDNGIRVSSLEEIGKLKPSFIRPHGTVTAANSSFLTDGASACLIASEERAAELGLIPKAYLRNFIYVAQDPKDQLLLGPAYAINKLLQKCNLKLTDIDVWEIHEAFAALDSDWFCKTFLNKSNCLGMISLDKLNLWGGSLSIGHPFAATGVRLVTHAVHRLIKEDGKLAIVSACAAGGQGIAMIIERHPKAQ